MAFDYEIKYKEGSSILHADAMSRLNFDKDDDECNLVDYLSSNLDELCVHFAEHELIPFEELRSECECRWRLESMYTSKEYFQESFWFPHSRERNARVRKPNPRFNDFICK